MTAASAPRVWFDVSFTRTQAGATGITRTVRRLLEAPVPGGGSAAPVAYHSSGFRSVPDQPPAATGAGTARTHGERLFAWGKGRLARGLVRGALKVVPWPWMRGAWERAADVTYDALSAAGEPVRFRPGDLLVFADASWNYPAWRAAREARRQGASIVLMVHDLMPIRRPDFCFPLVPKVFATFLAEMLRCSDAVLCNSRATRDDLAAWAAEQSIALPPTAHFRLGSDAAGSTAARHADAVRPAIAAFLAASPACFAAVGSFEPKKNYGLLLQAFERLWDGGHAMRLVIAGKDSPDCAKWTRQLRAHPEQGRRVLVLHDATDAEVAAIYDHAQALVFPSLFEGFGLPLVEARVRGCPVIASDIPAFVELADEGVRLFASGDLGALEQALLAESASGQPRPAKAVPFTWEASAQEFHRSARHLLAAR